MLIRKVTADKVLEGIKGTGGVVLKTSLDHGKDQALRDALKPPALLERPRLVSAFSGSRELTCLQECWAVVGSMSTVWLPEEPPHRHFALSIAIHSLRSEASCLCGTRWRR